MEVQRRKNYENSYDFIFSEDNKHLVILFAGNLDLYMKLECDRLIGYENLELTFDITKENYEIFSIFDALYNEIITGNVFCESDIDCKRSNDYARVMDRGNHINWVSDYRRSFAYSQLVDENNNITWISDDGPQDVEDKMQITKVDDDTYRLIFIRNDRELFDGFKSKTGICVRFRNSGSSYSPFNMCFMRMYQRLQNIDPDYHQVHFEELIYTKKRVK